MLRLRGETLGNLVHQLELQPIDQDKLVATHLRERFTYTTMSMARGGLVLWYKGSIHFPFKDGSCVQRNYFRAV